MSFEAVVTITDLARGGSGVARIYPDALQTEVEVPTKGMVVFVPFTLPGDKVRIRITGKEKRYLEGELLEIVTPSPDRVIPKCPVFQVCGGCQWQHIPYELQWKTKVKGVVHALDRLGISVPELEEIPAQQVWTYRNRVQLRGFQNEIGFLKRSSTEWVPIRRCEIAREEINETLEETRLLGSELVRPYKVEVEVTLDSEIKRAWNAPHAATGFRQVHDEQNERLKDWVKRELKSGGSVLYDLFGGSGNLSLGLKEAFSEIHCVDTGAPQVKDPAQKSGPGYFFHKAKVLPWILKRAAFSGVSTGSLAATPGGSDLDGVTALLDPPRAGLGQDFRDISGSLQKLGVKKVIHIGCDVDAWAGDLSKWRNRGWKIEKIMLLDLFPQTIHLESAAVLKL